MMPEDPRNATDIPPACAFSGGRAADGTITKQLTQSPEGHNISRVATRLHALLERTSLWYHRDALW